MNSDVFCKISPLREERHQTLSWLPLWSRPERRTFAWEYHPFPAGQDGTLQQLKVKQRRTISGTEHNTSLDSEAMQAECDKLTHVQGECD